MVQMKQPTRAQRILGSVGRFLNPDRLPVYYITAVLLTLLIECLGRHSVVKGFSFLFRNPLGFLVCTLIILLTLQLALLIPKRLPAFLLLTLIWFGLGVAEFILKSNRATPLSAVDFTILGSVITIMNLYLTVWQMVLIIAALVGAVGLIVFLFIKTRTSRIRWKPFGISFGTSAVCLALLIMVAFATGHLSDQFPNLSDAYDEYGFAYCFTLSLIDRGVDKPEDYGEEIITDILNELTDDSTDQTTPGTELPAASEKCPNVILVQLESFFDVNKINGITFSDTPTPFFDALSAQWISGSLTVPVIGAGTVNTEFEVLTGMRINDFGAGEYPYRSVLKDTTCETIAYDLLASGYRTHAIHNHEGTFYARNEVYRNMGFETFTPIEYFLHPDYNQNGWAKDTILTDEILYLLASTDEPDLVFAVSVQGHGKYPTDYVPAEGDITVTGGMENPESVSKLNYYVNQLREMDAFVQALTDAVMALEEDTVLVFYGDHQPSLSQDEGIELTVSDFETEYLIIANFALDRTPAAGRESLCAYQLFPLVMELIGNDTGVINRFHRTFRDSENYLEKLRTLEYDVLYGECFAYDGVSYPSMTDMRLGSRSITVTGYEDDGTTLTVTGENFTPYSVITIDGSEKETVYIDEHTLTARSGLFSEFYQSVAVRQINSKGEVMSECPPFEIPEHEKASP